ncbi:ABC transporter permease [Aureimonas sp. Leaf454]|uniref:ABC transporter permease n=1 Tax=Aureimonas sp. Leaf454 TaxID=1736381 RepID=UPI00070134DB|nr:ABC transporter permease subunit [Aureimonas sp. Leaf454]KQT54182.1 ABC transporter permease [Aureimonas sp. Leaf454]
MHPDAGTGAKGSLARLATLVLSVLVLLAVWWIGADLAHSRLVPTPAAVLAAGWADTRTGELPFHLAMTLLRVVAAFVVAMAIGAAIGIALGMNRAANRFFDPWLILFLNIPALVVIVLAYLWIGLNETAAIGAIAVNKIPNVVVTFREGARALDRPLAEMARIYRFGFVDRLRHLVLPQLQPYAAAAARSGLSLIWKIALVVELLGRSNGVGFQINLYFSLADVAAILAYTLAFVAVMLAIEILVLQPLERRATRWRGRHA